MFKHSAYFPVVTTEYCELYGQIIPSGKIFLHLNFKGKWSKDLLKDMIYDFNKVLDEFKEKGVKYIFVIIPNDAKLLKFETLFGFEWMCNLYRGEENEENIEALVLRRQVN